MPFLAALCLLFLLLPATVIAADIRIGVLAYRGVGQCLAQWSPTADYLTEKLRPRTFEIVPLPFEDMEAAIARGNVDFFIANPSIYSEYEVKYGASRIATLRNNVLGRSLTAMGGVVFFRAGRSDIRTLEDLRGKRLAATDQTSLGGWRALCRELRQAGIDEESDLKPPAFLGSHDEVVFRVLRGEADVGIVRTDTLERLAEAGRISLSDVSVLPYEGQRSESDAFPFLVSTRLYPEWPFAKLRSTPDDLARLVCAALLAMPSDSPAARAALIEGWTIPQNYQEVVNLLKELRLGPYADYGRATWSDFARQHLRTIVALAAGMAALSLIAIHLSRLNHGLKAAKAALSRELGERVAAEARLQESLGRLREANGQIMDSIECARSIQQAILPPPGSIGEAVADHFVIWSPRDVIGGDLFWFKGDSGVFSLAVMDCTGHGVPGAIMTMVAGTALNRACGEKGLDNPAALLRRLDEIIRDTLSRSDKLHDSGLDIGICSFDMRAGTLTFAGASISLFCAGEGVTEIKGARESIGYRTTPTGRPFVNSTISLAGVHAVYMMTDGIRDQVGGAKQLPFGKRRFIDFVQANSRKSCAEQRRILIDLLTSYRGADSQRDDVTLVCLKLSGSKDAPALAAGGMEAT